MKNLIISAIAAIAMLCGVNASAQSQFNKGDFALNLNYNLGRFDYGGWNNDNAQHGISLMGEYGFMNVINDKGTISAGAVIGAGFGGEDYEDVEFDAFRFRIATRGTLHYSFIPQLDTYAGITFLFVDINKYSWDYKNDTYNFYNDHSDTDVDFIAPSLFIGARYMFTKGLGVNTEFSWDRFAMVSVGLSFKF